MTTKYIPFSEEKCAARAIEWMAKYPSSAYQHPGDLIPWLLEPFLPFARMLDIGGGFHGTCGEHHWRKYGFPIERLDKWWPEPSSEHWRPMPAGLRIADALEIIDIYGKQSFDYVQATELIEHLHKADGRRLLGLIKQATRRIALLTTPSGYLAQNPEINPYDDHLSGWVPEEFIAEGYDIIYMNASQIFVIWTTNQADRKLVKDRIAELTKGGDDVANRP